jgi:hypothetical protein
MDCFDVRMTCNVPVTGMMTVHLHESQLSMPNACIQRLLLHTFISYSSHHRLLSALLLL